MAICEYCGLDMDTARSCVVAALHVNGEEFRLARHGRARARRAAARTGGGAPCGDCGVAASGLHHLGCDLQDCPRCGRQLLSCGCRFDEDGPSSAIDDEPLHISVPVAHDSPCWDEPLEPHGVDAHGNTIERGTINGVAVIVHRQDIPATDITTVHGIRCTTAVRTLIDIAVDLDSVRIRAIVVDGLRRGLFTEVELRQRLAQPDMDSDLGAEAVRRALDH